MGFMMVIHALISIMLMVIILMQSGRGGGLTEGFASAESVFGAQTNEFMIKATTVFAGLFLVTCLGLAVLSSQKGKSLMADVASQEQETSGVRTVETIPDEVPAKAAESVEAVAETVSENNPVQEAPKSE